jgi:hypothetical protein
VDRDDDDDIEPRSPPPPFKLPAIVLHQKDQDQQGDYLGPPSSTPPPL